MTARFCSVSDQIISFPSLITEKGKLEVCDEHLIVVQLRICGYF